MPRPALLRRRRIERLASFRRQEMVGAPGGWIEDQRAAAGAALRVVVGIAEIGHSGFSVSKTQSARLKR